MRRKVTSKMKVTIPEKGPTVPLRVHIPKDLYSAMESAATIKGLTVQALILERMGKVFGMNVPTPRKGRRPSE